MASRQRIGRLIIGATEITEVTKNEVRNQKNRGINRSLPIDLFALGTVTSVATQPIWYRRGGLSRKTAGRTRARTSENTGANGITSLNWAARRFGA